jgi:hypothetical protein
MTLYPNLPITICYPPGAGGSFVESALRHAVLDQSFNIGQTGNCHNPVLTQFKGASYGDDVKAFERELDYIKNLNKFTVNHFASGHLKNIIALQSIDYSQWFVIIDFDPGNDNEISFLSQIFMKKFDAISALADNYDQAKLDTWPNSYDEFVSDSSQYLELFEESHRHTLKSWYWIENFYTKDRTLRLSLQDIFLGDIANVFSAWFPGTVTRRIQQAHQIYKECNHQLYPDLIDLIRDRTV